MIVIFIVGFLCAICALPAQATYVPFDTSGTNNVGIGTSTPQSAIAVASGNVGIGTWTAVGGNLIVNGGGNVGISSAWPGQALDVNGTVRATAFIGNGAGLTNLPASGGWTLGASNVGISTTNNVGIGTNLTTTNGLVVMSGNVGIGTWITNDQLEISGSGASVNIGINNISSKEWLIASDSSGNFGFKDQTDGGYAFNASDNNGQLVVGIGTTISNNKLMVVNSTGSPGVAFANGGSNGAAYIAANAPPGGLIIQGNLGVGTYIPVSMLDVAGGVGVGTYANSLYLATPAPNGGMLVEGNVGIGSLSPGQALDVHGTVRMTGFTLNLNPNAGDVLVGSSVGVGTWMPASTLASGSVNSGTANQVAYYSSTGSAVSGAGSMVINGSNVGIGTTVPGQSLEVNGGLLIDGTGDSYLKAGNYGIDTTTPQTTLAVLGNAGIGTWTAANQLSVVGGAAIGSTTYANATAPTNGLIVQGNVGIGSNVPQGNIDVTSSSIVTSGTVNNSYNYYVAVPASTSSAIYQGVDSTVYFTGDGSGGAQIRGITGVSALVSNNTLTTNYGLLFYAANSSTGTITNNIADYGASDNQAGGTMTTAVGVDGLVSNDAGGAITTAYGALAAVTNSGAGTITTASAGYFSTAISAGAITTAYGVNIGTIQGTTKYSLFSSDSTAPSYFAANVGIGTWLPAASLQVAGGILSTGTSGIGYAKGAGATVTQTTNKSTGVTINAPTGTITMTNNALASDTIVSFTVTDSSVAATDCIFTQHDSGGTIGDYTITANNPGSGSFKITVRNNTGGSLSEAIVIRFAVIKAATS